MSSFHMEQLGMWKVALYSVDLKELWTGGGVQPKGSVSEWITSVKVWPPKFNPQKLLVTGGNPLHKCSFHAIPCPPTHTKSIFCFRKLEMEDKLAKCHTQGVVLDTLVIPAVGRQRQHDLWSLLTIYACSISELWVLTLSQKIRWKATEKTVSIVPWLHSACTNMHTHMYLHTENPGLPHWQEKGLCHSTAYSWRTNIDVWYVSVYYLSVKFKCPNWKAWRTMKIL